MAEPQEITLPRNQKERDDARCLAQIRTSARLWNKAEARRKDRFRARYGNPRQHPKWRKALATAALRRMFGVEEPAD